MIEEDKDVLADCLATLQTLRTHTSPSISIRHLEIVIHIYLRPGIVFQELTKLIPEISESSLRKYIKELGKVLWKESYAGASNQPAHNLIRFEENNGDYNANPLYLTDAGTVMMYAIAKKMQDSLNTIYEPPNDSLYPVT